MADTLYFRSGTHTPDSSDPDSWNYKGHDGGVAAHLADRDPHTGEPRADGFAHPISPNWKMWEDCHGSRANNDLEASLQSNPQQAQIEADILSDRLEALRRMAEEDDSDQPPELIGARDDDEKSSSESEDMPNRVRVVQCPTAGSTEERELLAYVSASTVLRETQLPEGTTFWRLSRSELLAAGASLHVVRRY